MRKSILAAAVVGALGWANVAMAGPLLPNFATNADGSFVAGVACGPAGLNTCIAGEGAAPNAATNDPPGTAKSTAVLHSDYIVMHVSGAGPTGVYKYFFQVENTSIFLVNFWQVSGTFTSVDFTTGKGLDLDLDADAAGVGLGKVGHNFLKFANLGTDGLGEHDPDGVAGAPFKNPAVDETEKTGDGALTLKGIVDPLLCFASSIICNFPDTAVSDVIPIGSESSIIIGTGLAPTPVTWNASGDKGTVSTNWNSEFGNLGNSEKAPGEAGVPLLGPIAVFVPEPGSILLLGTGLLGLGYWARRRRQS